MAFGLQRTVEKSRNQSPDPATARRRPKELIVFLPTQSSASTFVQYMIRRVSGAFFRSGAAVRQCRADEGAETGPMSRYLVKRLKVGSRLYASLCDFSETIIGKRSSRDWIDKFLISLFETDRENLALQDIFAETSESVVLLPATKANDIRQIFLLVPALRLARPLNCTLIIAFADDLECPGWLIEQLKTGSPFAFISLLSFGNRAVGNGVDIKALRVERDSLHCHKRIMQIFDRAQSSIGEKNGGFSSTITVEKIAPIALQVTGLWGRVGSSTVYDGQTKYLLDRGYFVVRLYVDWEPCAGAARWTRLKALAEDDFREQSPHLYFLIERNINPVTIQDITSSDAFRSGSAVLRAALMLSIFHVPAFFKELQWLGSKANLSIVNHFYHYLFSRGFTKAFTVLETHDLFFKLFASRGFPGLVPNEIKNCRRWFNDERKIWADADVCVNLSPSEHRVIAAFAKRAVLALPFRAKRKAARGNWPAFLMRNSLDHNLLQVNEFDVMLWGTNHLGNVRGVSWFLKEVIGQDPRFSQATVLIAGAVSMALAPFNVSDRIFLLGGVDDLDELFSRAKVLVIPDIDGTGISIKAIDVLTLGACFASTRAGLRGIQYKNTGYSPSASARALADDIATLLSDPEARTARAAQANQLYDVNLSFEAYKASWDAALAREEPKKFNKLMRAASRIRYAVFP